jgi:flagellar biosynthetic protein FliR
MTATALLVFARSVGLVFRAPGFSHPSVPAMVRLGFALGLTLAVAPLVAGGPWTNPAAFALAAASETLVGAAIGTGASLLYDGAYYAGRAIDDYVGVRGSVPTANVTSAQAFGRLWSSVFLAGFFLLDGYVPVVRAFADSFARVAPGALVGRAGWLHFALALPTTIVAAALAVAAPALAAALVVQVALAAVARVIPRMSGFSLTFPLVFAVAIVVTLAGIPFVAPLAARPWLVLPYAVR